MQGVTTLEQTLLHSGDYPLTIGGGGMAAGQNGQLLADWDDGNSAIGVKVLSNGARGCHIGGDYAYGFVGDDKTLLANCADWVTAELSVPDIATFQHTFGDNGRYDTDLILLDDDMGFVWDFANNEPLAIPGLPQTLSHNVFPADVQNEDPVLRRIRATATGDICLRMTGNSGNEVTLDVFDGTTLHTMVLTRDGGNPEFDCLTGLEIDVSAGAGAYVTLTYVPEDDAGSNPTWNLEGHFPGSDPHKIPIVFNSKGGVQVVAAPLGELMMGVPITFRVDGSDIGSDNLGVVWDWGDNTPFGIQVHEISDTTDLCGGENELLRTEFGVASIFDGCEDGVFERDLNTDRTPDLNPVSVVDVQSHAFTERYLFYVMVALVDDDNNEQYDSPQFIDGIMQGLLEIDFR
jgi:hypothetical protein